MGGLRRRELARWAPTEGGPRYILRMASPLRTLSFAALVLAACNTDPPSSDIGAEPPASAATTTPIAAEPPAETAVAAPEPTPETAEPTAEPKKTARPPQAKPPEIKTDNKDPWAQ